MNLTLSGLPIILISYHQVRGANELRSVIACNIRMGDSIRRISNLMEEYEELFGEESLGFSDNLNLARDELNVSSCKNLVALI